MKAERQIAEHPDARFSRSACSELRNEQSLLPSGAPCVVFSNNTRGMFLFPWETGWQGGVGRASFAL